MKNREQGNKGTRHRASAEADARFVFGGVVASGARGLRLAVVYNGRVATSENCASQTHRNAVDLPLLPGM
jgi:hypothetical protein